MTHALEYLKAQEWSMGNGQCPECYGTPESWFGRGILRAEEVGHEPNCKLARSIRELGGGTVLRGEFKSDKEYEHYITDSGLMGTREKTEHGCERLNDFFQRAFDALREDFPEEFEETP